MAVLRYWLWEIPKDIKLMQIWLWMGEEILPQINLWDSVLTTLLQIFPSLARYPTIYAKGTQLPVFLNNMHFYLHVWRLNNKYQKRGESLISSQDCVQKSMLLMKYLFRNKNRQIPSNVNQNQNHEMKHQIHQINEKIKWSLISLNICGQECRNSLPLRYFQESTSSNAWSNKSEDKIEFDISRTLCTRVSEIHAVERFYPRGQDPTQCASNPITTQHWKINNGGKQYHLSRINTVLNNHLR